jgi:dihydroxy-acid dehydratase
MTRKRRSELQFTGLDVTGLDVTGLGAIGVVADGDRMVIDLNARKLDLDVPEADIALRWKAYAAPVPCVKPGYVKFYSEHVAPASDGAVMPRF